MPLREESHPIGIQILQTAEDAAAHQDEKYPLAEKAIVAPRHLTTKAIQKRDVVSEAEMTRMR
jgi:hypothetical protein